MIKKYLKLAVYFEEQEISFSRINVLQIHENAKYRNYGIVGRFTYSSGVYYVLYITYLHVLCRFWQAIRTMPLIVTVTFNSSSPACRMKLASNFRLKLLLCRYKSVFVV